MIFASFGVDKFFNSEIDLIFISSNSGIIDLKLVTKVNIATLFNMIASNTEVDAIDKTISEDLISSGSNIIIDIN